MRLKTPLKLMAVSAISTLLLLPSAAFAGGEDVYTLKRSISEAIEKNWTLKSKQERIVQARQVKKQARAEFLPKFSTTYGYTRLNEPTTFGGTPITTQDNYQWKGTVSQPVFTGYALVSAYELSKLGIDQSKLQADLEKLDLALRVKQEYFGILQAEKALDVTKKAVTSLKSNVKVARSFYDVGMIPVNDLLKAEVDLANAEQNLVKARRDLRLARSSFNTVLARPINAHVSVEDILTYKPVEKKFDEYLKKAVANRPALKAIDVSLKQTDQQVRLTKSRLYPEVALTYDYIREGDDPDVDGSSYHDSSRWEVTAGLTWTFWEWGKTYYSVKEIESLKNELIQTRSSLLDNITLEVKEAFLTIEEAEAAIPTAEKALEQGEENLRVNEQRYKAQVTTITEVLDAQTQLTRARTNYYNALYAHHLAKARLMRAIGTF